MFAFIAVTLVGFTLSSLGAILIGIASAGGAIAGQLTGNSRLVNAYCQLPYNSPGLK